MGDAADWAWPLAFAEHACCCPAGPVVTVVMPPAPGRRYPMEVLLCGHHYRVCEIALLAAGATVYDKSASCCRPGKSPCWQIWPWGPHDGRPERTARMRHQVSTEQTCAAIPQIAQSAAAAGLGIRDLEKPPGPAGPANAQRG